VLCLVGPMSIPQALNRHSDDPLICGNTKGCKTLRRVTNIGDKERSRERKLIVVWEKESGPQYENRGRMRLLFRIARLGLSLGLSPGLRALLRPGLVFALGLQCSRAGAARAI
jgi:hypothetical protein